MNRILAIAGIAAATMTSLAAPYGAAHAQSPSVRAVAVAQLAPRSLVAGETLWSCGADGCVARTLTARPAVACAQVTKEVGELSSFTVGGTALSADELAKCNAKAKVVGSASRSD